MDVSVSVAAAIEEIHEKAPKLPVRELFRSGMHIGHDMIGTMSNTLIRAYTGSATGALMTLYSYEMPFLQILPQAVVLRSGKHHGILQIHQFMDLLCIGKAG